MPVNISFLLFVRVVKLQVLKLKKSQVTAENIWVKVVVKIPVFMILEKVIIYMESSLQPGVQPSCLWLLASRPNCADPPPNFGAGHSPFAFLGA
jgi:hypothetical protein